MHEVPTPSLVTIGIPTAWQCLKFVAPFLCLAVFWWFVNRLDYIIDHLFPKWEWERQLGWLNHHAHRRANTALRWLGYLFYASLAVALYGIIWGAQAVPWLSHWSEPGVLLELDQRFAVLFISLGVWSVYLGLDLLPKLRHQYESDELEKFRESRQESDEENRRQRAENRLHVIAKQKQDRAASASRPGPRRFH